jgi:methylated-DNA-[protein]-cysteine S-methyltransferase
MKPDTYFTVLFEMGQVVVHTSANGRVTGIDFDLEGFFKAKRASSTLGSDMRRYFEGHEVPWNLELDLDGLTDFTRRVYDRVARIPYGQTETYGAIARDVGCSGGGRAVGQAMAGNRFPLVVPCHRVIASGRAIGGFSSGIDLKRYLLRLEGIDI